MDDFDPKPPQARIVEPSQLRPALKALNDLIVVELSGDSTGRYRRASEILQAANSIERLYKLRVEDFADDGGMGDDYGGIIGGMQMPLPGRRRMLGRGAPMPNLMGLGGGNDGVREILEPLMNFAKDMVGKTNKKTEASGRRSRLGELREARDEAETLKDESLVKRLNDKIAALLVEIERVDDNANHNKENADGDVQEPAHEPDGFAMVPAFLPR